MLFIEECGSIYPSQHPPPRTCGVTSLCACTTYATDRHVATANKQNHLCVCTHSHTKDAIIAPEATPHFTSTPKHASHTPSPSLPNKHQHSSTLAAFPPKHATAPLDCLYLTKNDNIKPKYNTSTKYKNTNTVSLDKHVFCHVFVT